MSQVSVPGDLERALVSHLSACTNDSGVHVFSKLKIQATPQRSRTPDICVLLGNRPSERTLSRPPFICVEVISNSDMQMAMQRRIDDYLTFGVSHVWLIDPYNRRAWTYDDEGATEMKDGVLRTENPSIEVSLTEVFAGLDDARS